MQIITAKPKEDIKQKSERMSKLVRDYKSSGLTIKQYCIANKIKEKTFYYWLKKYKSADIIPAMPSIIPIDISAVNTEHNEAPALFAELRGLKLYQAVPAEYLLALLNN
ncbi:hypothetical protein [Chitinophaga sp. S165]|uniref:IS66 family insertion sequence element accessory protein TnpA n=1 Tax=Chitinophaga sp. S165 TaxID=2135462 RepID=UPI000D716089|nr:hypothetical protein [Chitinophaga sp. S165]PWV44392.1 hypothetical protein C7475_1251 [Chitinophaga sp. S165]